MNKSVIGLTNSVVCSLFSLTVSLFAREEVIAGSISPNKRYNVSVAEAEGRISYHLKDIRNRADVISSVSSYQPNLGSTEWAMEQSLNAVVHWRKDSGCIAVEEANHRRIGTVFIARRTANGFEQVPLDAQALMRKTKLPWERGRLFFEGWGNRDIVIIGLIGLVWADPVSRPPEQRRRKESSCGFRIATSNGAIVYIEPQDEVN
jgi:hypothetical protein